MSIIDPESVAAARHKLHGTAKMEDPDEVLKRQYHAQAQAQQRAANQILSGGMATIGAGVVDPTYEAERKAREEREMRTMCIHVAAKEHFGGGDVVTRAKQFYDFIKGS